MEEIAIKVENLHKYFVLPHHRANTLKSFFVNPFTRYENEKQLAFKDVDFEVKKGEFFGVVGRNGSGKSTLLKCMAGVYTTDKGSIKINGSLVPFIELGVGFNPELTGKDNIYLNGALLGFNRSEISSMYKEIVEFSELEKFMDQKLKNYSSGMQVRLAFSIAIRAHGDILLLDEVLAVGDSAFQQKCFDYFDSIKDQNKTIVLVTHNMGIIERYCDRAMFIDKGKIRLIGQPQEVARRYEELFLDEEIAKRTKIREDNKSKPNNKEYYKDLPVKIKDIRTVQGGKTTNNIKALTDFTVEVDFISNKDVSDVNVQINIKNRRGFVVIASDSEESMKLVSIKGKTLKTVAFTIPNNLTNGLYTFNVSFSSFGSKTIAGLSAKEPGYEFVIKGIEKYTDSITHPKIKATIK